MLISEAGIAGLTLAYWLKRYGWAPTLIEKHFDLRMGKGDFFLTEVTRGQTIEHSEIKMLFHTGGSE